MVVKRKRPSDADTKPASKPKPGSSNAKYDKTGPDKAKFRKGSATGASSRPGYKTDPASAKQQSVKRQKTTTSKFQHGASNLKGASSRPSFAAEPRPQADGRGKAKTVAKAPKDKNTTKTTAAPALVKRALLQDTVQKWEAIRRHDLGKDTRAPLVSAVLAEAKGRLAQLAVSHTGSRVVQACVKFATPEERASILAELRPCLMDLAKSSYAHFTVTKLIALAPKTDIPGLVRDMLPDVAHLLRHPCGASVVSALHDRASAEQRNAMAATFYGKEFSVLSQGPYPASLSSLLQATGTALKRQAILQQLTLKLTPIMEKAMVDAVVVHRLLAEYLQHSRGSAIAEAVEQLAGPAVLRMIHTQHGAYVGCAVFAYGTAKDRKKAIKSMKGHVLTIAKDGWAHVVLMAALTFTDDTALLRKYILQDLLGALEELSQHRHGSRVLLHLLRPLCPKWTPPQELALLTMQQRTRKVPAAQAGAADEAPEAADDEQDQDAAQGEADMEAEGAEDAGLEPEGAKAGTGGDLDDAEAQVELVEQVLGESKKPLGVRRAELFGSGLGSLAGRLVQLCTDKAEQLLRHPTGSNVLVEVAIGGEGGLVGGADALQPLHKAILSLCGASWPAEGHILEDWYASRAIRALCQASSSSQPAQQFASQLWDQVLEPKGGEALLSSHCGKIVHACCTSDDPALKAKALAKLPHLPQVRAEPKQLTVQAKRLQQKKNKKLLKSTQKQASL